MRNQTGYVSESEEDDWDSIVPQVAPGIDAPSPEPAAPEPEYVPAAYLADQEAEREFGNRLQSADYASDFAGTPKKKKSSTADKMEMWANIISAIATLKGSPEVGKAIQPFAGMMRDREDREKADATIGEAEFNEAVNVYGIAPNVARNIKKSEWGKIVDHYERRLERESRDNDRRSLDKDRDENRAMRAELFRQNLESKNQIADKQIESRENIAAMPRRSSGGVGAGGRGAGAAPAGRPDDVVGRLTAVALNVPTSAVGAAYRKAQDGEQLSPEEQKIVDAFMMVREAPPKQWDKYYGQAFGGAISRAGQDNAFENRLEFAASNPAELAKLDTEISSEGLKLSEAISAVKGATRMQLVGGKSTPFIPAEERAKLVPLNEYIMNYARDMSGATITDNEAANISKLTGTNFAGKTWDAAMAANPLVAMAFLESRKRILVNRRMTMGKYMNFKPGGQ